MKKILGFENSKKSILWLLLLVIVFCLVSFKFFGWWYFKIFNPPSATFLAPAHPEYIEGFIFAYFFFLSFLSPILLKNPWKALIWGLTIFVLLTILIAAWEQLLIEVVLMVAGLLLGLLIHYGITKFKR